jgi:hypothetical protein
LGSAHDIESIELDKEGKSAERTVLFDNDDDDDDDDDGVAVEPVDAVVVVA